MRNGRAPNFIIMGVSEKVKTFRATLERTGPPLKWVIIRIPFDVAAEWGSRGQVKITGEINGHAFQTSLFPRGNGEHYMLVNKQMQKGARVGPGMQADFRLQPDTTQRTATMPTELVKILRGEAALRRWYEKLNHSTRKDINEWVAEPKSGEARTRRAEQIAERLMETMEAEIELPPLIRAAFAANAKARAGWERMTPTQRRTHLLAIFYYRTPEARSRRLQKAVQAAVETAERAATRLKSK